MQFTDFSEFMAASEAMCTESPDKTRYSIKYRHKDVQLVLKVTNDREVLKYSTDAEQVRCSNNSGPCCAWRGAPPGPGGGDRPGAQCRPIAVRSPSTSATHVPFLSCAPVLSNPPPALSPRI